MRKWMLAMAACSCLGLTGCGSIGSMLHLNTAPAIAQVGKQAPPFALTTLQGDRTVSLQSLLAMKKPIIINAWAAWCENCKAETPDLVRLATAYSNRVEVVGIDTADNLGNAKRFAQHYGMHYLLLSDAKGTFMDAYNIPGLPTTIVIAPDGTVKTMHGGQYTKPQMAALFQMAAAL